MENVELKFGLREGKQITDYLAGSNSPIARQELTNGDWLKYKPVHEQQFNYVKMYDTLMCVTYATLDALESLFMYHISQGNISPDNVLWLKEKGYFKDGFINFNERYSGVNGKTTNQGAYAFDVINGIRHEGCIPQDMFPLGDSFKDNIDPKFITEEMKTLGKEFVKRFSISYEWVDNADVKEFLKYAPLTASVKYAQGEGILVPEGQPNHRIMVYKAQDNWIGVNDSYDELKKYGQDKVYSYMAYYLDITKNMKFKKEKNSPHIYAINEAKKTRTMIVDMETLNALDGQVDEVDTLNLYTDNGTLVWVNRIIN